MKTSTHKTIGWMDGIALAAHREARALPPGDALRDHWLSVARRWDEGAERARADELAREHPNTTDPTTTAYAAGMAAAYGDRHASVETSIRLRADPEFWQGFHDMRPAALRHFNTTILLDPTRPGGWCTHTG